MLPELNWLICGQLSEINLRSQQQIKVWTDGVTDIAKISCFFMSSFGFIDSFKLKPTISGRILRKFSSSA